MPLPPLPEGLTARRPNPADIEADVAAVVEVLRADEHHSAGDVHSTVADVRSDWNRPSMDLAADVVLVAEGDRVVGYADESDGRAWVGVHPDVHGRGVGTWLLRWAEDHARRAGRPRIGQTVADVDTAATALLRSAGYEPRWESWVFAIPLDDALAEPSAPEGLQLRPMTRPDEDVAVHEVVETAFSEWPDRDHGTPFEDWRAAHLDRDDVEVIVVTDGTDVVGAAVCLDEGEGEGWIEQLAVARSHRGRGLGRLLLQAAFRRFSDRGCTTAGLSTDSRTGAKDLYEHVGMAVTVSYTRWSRELS